MLRTDPPACIVAYGLTHERIKSNKNEAFLGLNYKLQCKEGKKYRTFHYVFPLYSKCPKDNKLGLYIFLIQNISYHDLLMYEVNEALSLSFLLSDCSNANDVGQILKLST